MSMSFCTWLGETWYNSATSENNDRERNIIQKKKNHRNRIPKRALPSAKSAPKLWIGCRKEWAMRLYREKIAKRKLDVIKLSIFESYLLIHLIRMASPSFTVRTNAAGSSFECMRSKISGWCKIETCFIRLRRT